jgi:alpha-ketoglutaric semialdehyde dehydrogenase
LITGKNYIGFRLSAEGKITFKTYNPLLEEENPTLFFDASWEEIDEAVKLASRAFEKYKNYSSKQKLVFFRALESEMCAAKKNILDCYQLESGLSNLRAENEFNRTILQIQQFSELLEANEFVLPSIDTKILDQNPPKADVRKIKFGLGPIAVFGASNFPLAYSTLGGDTVAALAAGCPVIVKSHPMHAGTGELVAQAVVNASRVADIPEGVFSNLNGSGNKVGEILVNHPMVKGVAFTGSLQGGRALFDIATKRKEPIPVFAEMGSLNPIVVDYRALSGNSSKWSSDIAHSVTDDAGQFCTKPGLIFISAGQNVEEFIQMLMSNIQNKGAQKMVHPNLKKKFENQLIKLSQELNSFNSSFPLKSTLIPQAINITGSLFIANSVFQEEFFGPFCFIVKCKDDSELRECIESLDGQLTASIFTDDKSPSDAQIMKWISIFQNKAGRLIFNNVPTGVRVCASMHHGGPYPASTDNRFGAVGVDSIERFLRPLCFQNFPDSLLPDALKDKNPLNILRRINGKLSFAEIIS